MRFTYCPDCGKQLILKEIGDEGLVPYCEACARPWFDMFPSCIIVLVANDKQEVALLGQSYISTKNRTLVSGYMKPGESAEETAEREVMEELGIRLKELRLIRTIWFEKRGMLMLAFIGQAENTDFHLSSEVDEAAWVPAKEAIKLVHPKAPGVASYFLVEKYLEEIGEEIP